MSEPVLSVRELCEEDINLIANYWLDSDPDFMVGMGVDLDKIPAREDFCAILQQQLRTPIKEKNAYCFIWQVGGKPVGHCNTNPTVYGDHAYMHLHMWNTDTRKKGMGTELVKMSLPYFFDTLKLNRLYSEPYALNPAPNRTLEKAGFELVKEYVTTPGSLNFEQPVKRWEMSRERFKELG